MDLEMWGIGKCGIWGLKNEVFLDMGDGGNVVVFGLDITVLCITFEVNDSTQS